MNGMNFKPFISKVLNSLSDAQLVAFAKLIDSHSNEFTKRSLIDANNLITNDDKGVGLFTIQLDSQTIRTGYLVFTDSYCVLLSYVSNAERVTEYEINLTTNKYEVVKEFLTTDYLRHEVLLRANGAVDAGKIETDNITGLTKEQLNSLQPGDFVIKKTGNQKHTYIVSYKGEGAGEGICLTYCAAGYTETVSYDRSGNNWVYNSTDVVTIPTQANIVEEVNAGIQSGDIQVISSLSQNVEVEIEETSDSILVVGLPILNQHKLFNIIVESSNGDYLFNGICVKIEDDLIVGNGIRDDTNIGVSLAYYGEDDGVYLRELASGDYFTLAPDTYTIIIQVIL